MKTKLANATHDDNRVLLLHQDGTAEIWNNRTQQSEHWLSGAASIRHALRHDFAELTLAGAQWLRQEGNLCA